ncbi:MAG: hypothetical protein KI790_03005 [Cyclobacteriaceae bacterium]|nr:hypothetical protein [Cyclobacteriaceae bacterium HetDA_MAG_MS6]
MDFKKFSVEFAEEIDGQYTEYDEKTSLFIVPLPESRHQMVIAEIKEHPQSQRQVIDVTSKVCPAKKSFKYMEMLEAAKDYDHTRFIIDGEFLKAEASHFLNNVDQQIVKEMILEVAHKADEWELELTGKDIQ